MSTIDYCAGVLETLKLQGAAKMLSENDVKDDLSNLEFLKRLLENEVNYRKERRLKRNLAGSHFPVIKRIEDFEVQRVDGINKQQLNGLLDFTWIDRQQNLLFFGPPGIGKTHLSIALGYEAIQKGYKVCFERITSLVKLLKTMDVQRSSTFRINRIMRADALIIDEIGYTPIDRKEANLFFSLVSELYEKSSIIITSNKGFESWAEMLGDEVMTTALLDRLLHHAHVFSLAGESYRISRKKEE